MDKPDNIELRDWFAGMALNGMISDKGINSEALHEQNIPFIEMAYIYADKMLKEREKRDG